MTGFLRRMIILALLIACGVSAAQEITFREETITLPWFTSILTGEAPYGTTRSWWSETSNVRKMGDRSLKGIWIENEYLAVLVLPEAGGVVGQAIYKPTGDEIFYWEGKLKDFLPYWDSGIKLLFPSSGHSVYTHGQAASYRTFLREDGTGGVVMWMEFSRFNTCSIHGHYDRFSNVMVSQQVSLEPGRAELKVTYRLINPAPYRQGRKIWTGAYFPRIHNADGVFVGDQQPPDHTSTEIILPTEFIASSRGSQFRRFNPALSAIALHRTENNVWNAWAIPYGFAGLWYPEVKVNRLRLTNAEETPGTRFYFRGEGTYRDRNLRSTHIHNFIEIFGSYDSDSHGCEKWIEAGQVEEMVHRYQIIYGIGKVSYADENAVVSVSLEDATVEVVTPVRVAELSATWNGEQIGQPQQCSPEQPARFQLPPDQHNGRLVLTADGETIIDQEYPLPMSGDRRQHRHIRTSYLHAHGDTQAHLDASERFGPGDYSGYLRLLQRAPEGSLSLGRVQYRAGFLDIALATLRRVTEAEPENGEAWHLTGAALIELGREEQARPALEMALSVAEPHERARYFLALINLRTGNRADAAEQLSRLIEYDPKHWDARLLEGWILSDDADSRGEALAKLKAMADEDPGDPRVQAALSRCALLAGDESLSRQAAENMRLIALEDGTWKRIREFNAATRGIYAPPLRKVLPENIRRSANR